MHGVFNEPSCTYNGCMGDSWDTGGNLRDSMRGSIYNAGCTVGSYGADLAMSALGAFTGLGVGRSMALTAAARASHASEGVGHAFGSGLASMIESAVIKIACAIWIRTGICRIQRTQDKRVV